MSKIIYQQIPADLWNNYKQVLLSGFQFGWNFYVDDYMYTYALVVRKVVRKRLRYPKRSFPPWRTASPHVRRKKSTGPLVTIFPWVIFNQLLMRWSWRIATIYWMKEPAFTDRQPPQACQYGRKYWKDLYPAWQSVGWPNYVFMTSLFTTNLRRPPWGTVPWIFLTNSATNCIYCYDIEEGMPINAIYNLPVPHMPFNNPMGICEHNGLLYIVDNGNKRIQIRYTKSLMHITNITFWGPQLTYFDNITDIASDSSYLYVLEETKNTLIRINKSNVASAVEVNLMHPNYGNISKPSYITLSYDRIYITSETDNRIIILDKSTLLRIAFTSPNESAGQNISGPAGIDHDGGFLYIAEKGPGNIVTSPMGAWWRTTSRTAGGVPYDVCTIGWYYITICSETGRLRIWNRDNPDYLRTITDSTLIGCKYMCPRQQQYFQADVRKNFYEIL